jgi:HEAT repeat protein
VTVSRRSLGTLGIDTFERLAQHDPALLAELCIGTLRTDPVLLSQAAEAMALGHGAELLVPVLLDLLRHERPFVREAALLGLSAFLANSLQARDAVREFAQFDPSPGVRSTAADVLAVL